MRLTSTLCLLLFALIVRGQVDSPTSQSKEVIVTTWCAKRITSSELPNPKIPDPNSLSKALAGRISCLVAIPAKKDTAKSSTRIRMHCQGTVNADNKPLIVIDGVLVDNKVMGDLNPNEIQNIAIMKGAAATAIYGSQAANGVIIITTKQNRVRKFVIKDFVDGSSIPGATVSFVCADNKNSLMLVANDSGVVVTDKLKSSIVYEMKVSAVGYNTLTKELKNNFGKNMHEVQLGRAPKTCENVLVRSYPMQHRGCPSYCFVCRASGVIITVDSIETGFKVSSLLNFQVYPNPVERGSLLNLVFDDDKETRKSVRIISIDGREMLRQPLQTSKGKNLFQLSMDRRWAAGIYFVQLVYENERVLASDKIIIQ